MALIPGAVDGGTRRLRFMVAIAGAVYLFWWFTVELLLPGSFNPLPGRLLVVALDGVLLFASYRSRWVERHLSTLFTAWTCLLVYHYCYLLIGNHGDTSWWIGTFITFAAVSMCVSSPREVAIFSLFALACVIRAATIEEQVRHSIYIPGLATILLLANITKRSQMRAQDATLRAEHAHQKSQKADEQRLHLAAIVESSGDAIVACTLQGRIQSWNKGAENLFGYAAEEVVGQPLSLLFAPEGRGDESELIARVAAGASVEPLETKQQRKDGTLIDTSVTISPIRESGDALVGASMAARDISKRKGAEAEALKAREVAEAANRDLEAFSYSVAHDLRAPLRGIDGFSHTLLEEYGDALDETGHGYLRRVRDSANEMGRLIDALLELGRLSRVGIRKHRVDLSALARATVKRLKDLEPGRTVEFVIQGEFTEEGDRALLAAAIENLLGNAWKFTRNRPNARIEFGCVQEGGRSVYFVRDNGAGFDMAFASKLFGVFQRLHTQSEFEGTGVGLATVQRIMQRHGGSVWAEGKVGEGACFHFTIADGDDARS